MFSTAQLAELATFNSMQAFETWKLQQAAVAQAQSLEQQLTAERNAHGALEERFDSLNADYDRAEAQLAALNAQIEAMRTLHAVELGATRFEKEALEAELQSRPAVPPGVYLDGAQQLVAVPAAAAVPAEKAWVTGE